MLRYMGVRMSGFVSAHHLLASWGRFVGPPALFMLLSAGFLWQPILSGQVFLPADISFHADPMWRSFSSNPAYINKRNALLSDVSLYYYPYAWYAIERLGSGHFPLWNPYILSGTPFFASSQAAVLDPINLFTYLASP